MTKNCKKFYSGGVTDCRPLLSLAFAGPWRCSWFQQWLAGGFQVALRLDYIILQAVVCLASDQQMPGSNRELDWLATPA